ncbi:MAG TPA: ComF family protein [Chitinophagales bacterium]|nr:ComF family protein [Chitinophagales bacterium]
MKLLDITAEYLNDFAGLLFPNHCQACQQPLGKGEDILCLFCQYELPQTDYHRQKENPVEKLFWGRVEIQRAAGLYFFHGKTKVQHLLHQLKYHGKKEIAHKLGRMYGGLLKESDFADDIDLIVPVPLHEKKKRKRGYNQSDFFAMGLSESLGIDWSAKILRRNVFTETQTGKTRFERWGNVGEVFKLREAKDIAGKHVLLVDDVITTGATLEACAHSLLQAEGTRVSIATIAVTH